VAASEKAYETEVTKAADIYKASIVSEERVDPEAMYREYLPVYTLQAACGYFGEGVDAAKEGWLKVDVGRKLDRNMFISRVCACDSIKTSQ
jgi:hypothetical protein